MRNVLIVVKHEILTTLAKPSFWLMTFVFPVFIIGFTMLPQLMAQDAVEGTGALPGLTQPSVQTIGYVDEADAIRELPPDLPGGSVRAFRDEAAAQAALTAGEIGYYFVLPPDLAEMGKVTAVSAENAPLASIGPGRTIEYLINYNLTGNDTLARLVMDPLGQVDTQAVAPDARPSSSGAFGFTLPFVVMYVLFFVITMSAGYMLQSVAKEKENRTAEVLLVSLRPRELMLGKVIGLGTVALLQMVVWFGGGALLMRSGLAVAVIASGQGLPVSFILWTAVYFLLGYLIYASLLGALGALAPTMREGSQFTFVLLLPLLVPVSLNTIFVQDPSGPAATILSLFPLTAPTAMVTRMAVTSVPFWQPVVGIVLLLVTAYGLVLLSARFFRADTLLSSDSLNWGRIARELRANAGKS